MAAIIPTLDEIEALLRRVVREELGARSPGIRKEVVSKRTAATMLGIDRGKTLAALIADGTLRAVEIRGRVCIPRADVEKVIAAGASTAAPTPRRKVGVAGGAAALRALTLDDL